MTTMLQKIFQKMDKWLLFTINLPKLAILRKVVDFVTAQKIFGKLFAQKRLGWQQCCKNTLNGESL